MLRRLLPCSLVAPPAAQGAAKKRTVDERAARLAAAGAIPATERDERLATYRGVKRTVKRLPRGSTRRNELAGAVADVDGIAARRALTGAAARAALADARAQPRVVVGRRELGSSTAPRRFPGSQLVWQWFPGQGLQFHPLANFAKLNSLWAQPHARAWAQLLDELLRARASRAPAALAWEYYFAFGGGKPPWVLGPRAGHRASRRSPASAQRPAARPRCCRSPRQALGVFETAAARGRARADGRRRRTTPLYSFAPGLRVINGFIQSLVGLYDFGEIAGDPRRQALYADGERVARARGADVRHRRVVAVLARHDRRTSPTSATTSCCATSCAACATARDDPVYCDTEPHFTQLPEPSRRELRSHHAAARRHAGTLRLRAVEDLARRACACRARRQDRRSGAAGRASATARAVAAAGRSRARRGDYDVRSTGDRPRRQRRRRAERDGRGARSPSRSASAGRWVGCGAHAAPRRSSTRARAASARRPSPPPPPAAAPPRGQRTIVLSTDPAHSLADVARGGGRRASRPQVARRPVGPAGRRRRTSWSATGRPCRGGSASVLVERGVDRIAAEELTVPPGGDELFSLLRLKRHVEAGEWDVDRRRLRADRRDAAAAVVPRRRALVAGQGVRARAQLLAAARPLARAFLDVCAARRARCSPRCSGWSTNLIAMNEILRDRERGLDPARDDAGPDGDRRGDADVHLPEPVRLPDRRGGRQPRLPGRGRRHLLRRLARASSASSSSSSSPASPPCRCCARRTSSSEVRRRRRCSTGSATRCSATRDAGAVLHDALAQELSLDDDGARAAARPPVRASKGDISLKKIGARAGRARRRAEAHDHAPARARRAARRPAPRSTTARWW